MESPCNCLCYTGLDRYGMKQIVLGDIFSKCIVVGKSHIWRDERHAMTYFTVGHVNMAFTESHVVSNNKPYLSHHINKQGEALLCSIRHGRVLRDLTGVRRQPCTDLCSQSLQWAWMGEDIYWYRINLWSLLMSKAHLYATLFKSVFVYLALNQNFLRTISWVSGLICCSSCEGSSPADARSCLADSTIRFSVLPCRVSPSMACTINIKTFDACVITAWFCLLKLDILSSEWEGRAYCSINTARYAYA